MADAGRLALFLLLLPVLAAGPETAPPARPPSAGPDVAGPPSGGYAAVGAEAAAGPTASPGAELPAAEARDSVRLRLRAREGEALTYRFESTTRVAPPPQFGSRRTVRLSMELRRRAEAVTPDSIRFHVEISAFDLTVEADSGRVSPQLRRMARQSREQAVGKEFLLTVTPAGDVIRLSMGRGQTVAGGRVDRSIRQLVFSTLPLRAVSVGESWTSVDTLDGAAFGTPVAGRVLTRSTATLEEVSATPEGRVAGIQVESSYGFQPASSQRAGMEVELEGSSQQEVRFDVDRGRLLQLSGSQRFTVRLTMSGGGRSFTIEGSGTSTARLVDG